MTEQIGKVFTRADFIRWVGKAVTGTAVATAFPASAPIPIPKADEGVPKEALQECGLAVRELPLVWERKIAEGEKPGPDPLVEALEKNRETVGLILSFAPANLLRADQTCFDIRKPTGPFVTGELTREYLLTVLARNIGKDAEERIFTVFIVGPGSDFEPKDPRVKLPRILGLNLFWSEERLSVAEEIILRVNKTSFEEPGVQSASMPVYLDVQLMRLFSARLPSPKPDEPGRPPPGLRSQVA